MKIALVYDRINKIGGAERVLEALHEIWPNAPVYTSIYDKKNTSWANGFQIIPSFLQKFLPITKYHELVPYLMPIAFESFNSANYDIVISITSESAKGIIVSPKTLHICYCLTPTRYLWSGIDEYFSKDIYKKILSPIISYLKRWDLIASKRPDILIAISQNVQNRIKKFYGRKSVVIYPPVDTNKLKTQSAKLKAKEKYFLVVSRLVKYKRVDIAIEAFNKLGIPLYIIGTGAEEKKLKYIANKNIKFLGQLTDGELLNYYQNCRALIFPPNEDFGIVPLEANSCGKPVIAYKSGGALETIIPGKTGDFFQFQTAESLIKSIKNFKDIRYQEVICRRQAEKFSKEIFKKKFKKYILNKWKIYKKNISTV